MASQDAPANAIGASTTPTSSSALRINSENQTIATAAIISPARKIVTIAPTPGAAMLMPLSPAASRMILSPIVSVVSPDAWMMPMLSWSTISSASAVNVTTTNAPSTDFAAPSAARDSAVGSRRISPVMSCRQKKMRTRKTPMPKIRL